MSSKTSSSEKIFSKAIVLSDIRLHWIWMVVATVILLLNVLVFPNRNVTYNFSFNNFISYFGFSFFFAALFGFFIGTKLFMYLDKTNSVSFMHGLPFSRRKLYISHLLSGIAIIAAPAFTSFVMMLFLNFGNPLMTARRVLAYFAIYMIYALITFAISVFSMTVCGNVVVSMLFSFSIVILPVALSVFILGICNTNLYGFVSNGNVLEKMLEFIYIFPDRLFPWRFAIYLGLAAIFLIAGFLIYKVRPLENCEEVVAFKKLRGLFIYAVGLVCGMISYLFFAITLSATSILTMLPLGIVGIIVSTMIAQKSISLRGTPKYLGIFAGVVVTLALCLHFDLFGYERRVPAPQNVEYIEISNDYGYYHSSFIRFTKPDTQIEKTEDIEKVVALHKAYISDKDSERTDVKYHYDDNFVVRYHLKNGLTLTRSYNYLSDENYEKYMLPVRSIREYKEKTYPAIDSTEKELIDVTVWESSVSHKEEVFSGSSDEAREIYAAIEKDIEANSAEQLVSNGFLKIQIRYYVPGKYADTPQKPITLEDKMMLDDISSFYINSNFTETLKVLEKYGILDSLYPDLDGIGVILDAGYEEGEYYTYDSTVAFEKYGKYDKPSTGVMVTDKTDVNLIYEYTRLGGRGFLTAQQQKKALTVGITFVNRENDQYYWSNTYYILPEELPQVFAKYLTE